MLVRNVTTEVNTVFRDVVDLLKQVDPAKLKAVLSAFAEGLRGHGEIIGQAITDPNQVLQEVNARRTPSRQTAGVQDDRRRVRRRHPRYLDRARRAATTSTTITNHATNLDALL